MDLKKFTIIIFILMIFLLSLSFIIPLTQIDFSGVFSFIYNTIAFTQSTFFSMVSSIYDAYTSIYGAFTSAYISIQVAAANWARADEPDYEALYTDRVFIVYNMVVIDEGDYLAGEMNISFVNLWDEPLDTIQLNLPANITGADNIVVSSLMLDDVEAVYSTYFNDRVLIYLPETLMPGDTAAISLTFETHFIENFIRFGRHGDIYLLALWHPVVAPRANGDWVYFPWVRHADPYFFEASIFHVDFYTDKYVISPHIYSHEDNRYTFRTLPIRDFSLVMGEFGRISYQIPNGPEIIYYSGAHRNNWLEYSVDIFNFLTERLGPYPYPYLVIIDVPMEYFRGMELSGMIFFNNHMDVEVFTLAHEIAHQWWYGLVGNNQITESWIDEGLANYWAYKYTYARGMPVGRQFRGHFIHMGRYYQGFSLLRDIRDFPSRHGLPPDLVYRQAVYLRGADFWIRVENIIGEEETFNFLRRIQEEYRFRIITTDSIIQALVRDYGIDETYLYSLLN